MFRIYMVISSFFCIFISQKQDIGYGRITTVDSSETSNFWRGRPSRVVLLTAVRICPMK